MPRLKRTRDEAELDLPEEPQIAPELQERLTALRNQWEFASFMQYVQLFGSVVKIDDGFEIEDLEAECLRPTPSDTLPSVGLALLKYVSSHRGLTLDLFDEYTRRQYLAKAPERNPFGDEEEPLKFNDLDVFTRIRILHQLSNWTFYNADRIRGMMPEDEDHLDWRMEPLGWDKEDRAYFVLDDNRLYRRTDEPVPPPAPKAAPKKKGKLKSKAKSKSKTPQKPINRGTRASKRIKLAEEEEEEEEAEVEGSEIIADDVEDVDMTNGDIVPKSEEPGFGFTSKTWECVAVTLEDYQEFLSTIFRSRDPNEKILKTRIEENVLPILEKRAESIRQKKLKKIRELENLSRMATAKRSGRLADKAEKEKQERDEREAEEKRRSALKAALAEQERQRKIEEGHESRRLTREQRVRERETKRILHEEELLKLEEEASRATSQDPNGDGADSSKRISERNLKTQREQHQQELDRLAAEDDGKWYFDCSVCGLHGDNLDDGTHSVACDRCSVWQHSKCHGFTPKQAEKEGFVFVCATCKRKEEDAAKPKIPSLKLGRREGDSSRPATANGPASDSIALNGVDSSQGEDKMDITKGPSLSPSGQTAGPPGQRLPPVSNFALKPPQEPWQGSPLPLPEKHPSDNLPVQGLNGHTEAHQNAHQAAVTSAGGHNHPRPSSAISSSASPQRNNLSTKPFSPAASLLTPQHSQFLPQLPPSSSTPAPQLLKGFQSPIKQPPPQPTSSPPTSFSSSHPQQNPQQGGGGAYSTPQQRYTPSILHERSPQLHQSPKTDLPPPTKLALNSQQAGISPVKSSPAAPAAVPGSLRGSGSFVGSFGSSGIVGEAPVLEGRTPGVLEQKGPVKRDGEVKEE